MAGRLAADRKRILTSYLHLGVNVTPAPRDREARSAKQLLACWMGWSQATQSATTSHHDML